MERFNKCLEQLVDHHPMFPELSALNDLSKVAPEVTVKAAFNKWDKQLEEFIHCSEKKGCGKVFYKVLLTPVLSSPSGYAEVDYGDELNSTS
jgi:hypothetical protein